jgi:uncharacterized protein YndB with AHSA1/START domain
MGAYWELVRIECGRRNQILKFSLDNGLRPCDTEVVTSVTKRRWSMEEQSVIHSTFVIERSYPVAPEKVFAAFSDPAKKRRWYAGGERGETHHVEEFEMDFRVGGKESTRYRMNESTPFPGTILANVGNYHEIAPNRRIINASTMSLGERPISVSLVTFEFLKTEKGTDLIFTHQGVFFEMSGGEEMRKQGWQKLFDQLAKELGR